MALTVRPFRTDEAAALTAIRHEALADLPMAFAEHLDAARAKGGEDFTDALSEQAIWGAFDDDRPLAMAGLRRGVGGNVQHRAMIVGVYVSPAARGTGVSRAMLQALIDYGIVRGVEIFELAVGDFNVPARKLYAGLGFVEVGLLRNAVKIGADYTHEINMALHVEGVGAGKI